MVFSKAGDTSYLCDKIKICNMSITVSQGLSGKYFSATVPDLIFEIGGTDAVVVLRLDGDEVYSERLFPVGGSISIRDVGDLVRPYAKARLVTEMTVNITERDANESNLSSTSLSCTIVYCEADIDMAAEKWCETHFLTILMGARVTSLGRLEYLHYIGTDSATVTAYYSDGSTGSFAATVIGGNTKYTTIDCSPARYTAQGKTLTSYVVKAGSRSQQFDIDFSNPDCAPILVFNTSFGCEELLYCIGKETISAAYKYDTAYIEGKNTNYKVTETTSFKADTGPLSFPMADWCRELFRSDYVRIVNVYGGTVTPGKEMIVSDPKVEYGNNIDELPRITFTVQYAQKNHNVIQTARAGRIFDNTFDYTFN